MEDYDFLFIDPGLLSFILNNTWTILTIKLLKSLRVDA